MWQKNQKERDREGGENDSHARQTWPQLGSARRGDRTQGNPIIGIEREPCQETAQASTAAAEVGRESRMKQNRKQPQTQQNYAARRHLDNVSKRPPCS